MAESGTVLDIIQRSKDDIAYSHRTIDHEHSEIHSGKYYTAKINTSALGASSWVDMEIITPSTATAVVHLYVECVNSGGLAEIVIADLSTSSTYTHGATAVNRINRNRLSSNTANMTVFTAGTNGAFLTSTMTSTQATLLDNYYLGSTGSVISAGSYARGRNKDELVLAGASTYVVRLWNRNAAGAATLAAYWYEV